MTLEMPPSHYHWAILRTEANAAFAAICEGGQGNLKDLDLMVLNGFGLVTPEGQLTDRGQKLKEYRETMSAPALAAV